MPQLELLCEASSVSRRPSKKTPAKWIVSKKGPSVQSVPTKTPRPKFFSLAATLQRCLTSCPTFLKTAEKQPMGGCRVGHGKTAGKTAETPEKQPESSQKQLFFSGVSAVFPAVFWLVYHDPLGTLFGCPLFGCFQCRAFGTSVGGRGDCRGPDNPSSIISSTCG